mmetsp:Transcript_65239/g.172923  ORF Transcript_65239/g.172923 Transcript_65239/m.172923 type:complete len:80 (+) Transcript_65239:42-281(+)
MSYTTPLQHAWWSRHAASKKNLPRHLPESQSSSGDAKAHLILGSMGDGSTGLTSTSDLALNSLGPRRMKMLSLAPMPCA